MIRFGDKDISGDSFREAADLMDAGSKWFRVAAECADEGNADKACAAIGSAGKCMTAAGQVFFAATGATGRMMDTDGASVFVITKPEGGFSDGEPG